MTEELAFEKGVGDGAAVDADELHPPPIAVAVDELRQNPFPVPVSPGQQNGALRGRYEADLVEDGPHGLVPGLNDVQGVGLPEAVPQVVELRLRPDALMDALRHVSDLIGVQRIGYVVGRTGLHRFDRLPPPSPAGS